VAVHISIPTFTPCLCFDNDLEGAAKFYVSAFPDSSMQGFTPYTDP